MKPKVLITAKEVHELIPLELAALGYEITHLPEPSQQELLGVINQYVGLIITTYTQVDTTILNQAHQLQFIGRVGSGLENVDLEAAATKGIAVFSSPEGNANAVGEHALTLLLNLMNRIHIAHREVQQGIWLREENRGEELDGKTVGIIGFGHTGSAFARKLRGFDVEVLAYDKFKSNYGNDFVRESSLEEIVGRAQVISLHIPYTIDNHHFVNIDFVQKLQKKPYLIHTCRGAVADTHALVHALQNQQIKALGIDVFEDEPWHKSQRVQSETYEKLLQHPQVIATPHIAGWTQESKIKLASVLMNKIKHFVQNSSV